MSNHNIDWTVFEGEPLPTVYCRCDAIYHSHVKGLYANKKPLFVSQSACPSCGKTEGHIRRVSHPPEEWTIG